MHGALWLALLAAAGAAARGPLHTDAEPARPQDDDECLLCVCRAMGANGECVTGSACTHKGTFGPFCISEPYWIDAGRPVLPGDNHDLPGAFRRCVAEPFCAVRTVRGYMDIAPALQDCDKNGQITCRDLLLTHLHGRYACVDKPDARLQMLARCLNTTESPARPSPTPSRPGGSHVPGGSHTQGGSLTPGGSQKPRVYPTPGSSPNPGDSPLPGHGGSRGSPRDTLTDGSSPFDLHEGSNAHNHREGGNENHGYMGGTHPDAYRAMFNSLRGDSPITGRSPFEMKDVVAHAREVMEAFDKEQNNHARDSTTQ